MGRWESSEDDMNNTAPDIKANSDEIDSVAKAMPNTPSQETIEGIEADLCDHDWQRDGQTLMSVRWTCAKCGKTMLC